MKNMTTITKSTIDRQTVMLAAEQSADAAAIFNDAMGRLASDPGAIYDEHVIAALKTIRQKSEAEYVRMTAKATGHKTRLDKLTAPERDDRDDSIYSQLIDIAKQHCVLGHDPDGRGVAIIEKNNVRKVWYVDGHGFKEWLRATYFEDAQSGINSNALDTVIATISAIGKHQGDELTVHSRAARHKDAYYIDLCDDLWRAIRIDSKGWEVVSRPPVLFTRSKNMRPIPEPQRPGDINKIWKHINIPENRRLPLLAWLLDSYRPDTPFPILELSGEQGSAKSSTQRRLRDLIDPNKVALRARPKTVEDIYVSAANNWIVSFENISHLTPEQQDALCTLATGGGFASRQFYTNGDEFVLETKRPIMINGINAVATQPDLIERVISIEAPTIPANKRRDEQSLENEWQADYPYVLAGLFHLFSTALRILPKVKLAERYRMADYQMLGEAIARAHGHAPKHFSQIYGEAANEGIERSLETYGIAHAIQIFMNGMRQPWEGTVLDLLGELTRVQGTDRSNWPKSPRGLSGQVKRIAPGLRLRGIAIEKLPHKRNGAIVRITLSENKK